MTEVTGRDLCCGCSACMSICPKKAISMKPDTLGFLYPEIKQDECIDCGLCRSVCDFTLRHENPLGQNDDAAVYACRHKNAGEVATSQSGAATVAVSDWILEHGGVVYGAGYKEHFRVAHKRAETKEARNEFKGSKYVQSDMGNCFADAEKDLRNGRHVLFTGTGCQIAGFLSYIRKRNVDSSRLVTCDIICHGVPSPRLWQDYLHYVETNLLKKPVVKVDFRDKTHYGWASHKETFYTTYTTYTTYTYIFYDHIAFRRSCYSCPYAATERLSDFTVCDFWGYEKVVPDMGSDNKGLSLMFVTSQKAAKIFEEIKEKLVYRRVNVGDCLQHNMQSPSVPNMNRNKFEHDYAKHGFGYIMKKYGKPSFLHSFVGFGKKCVKKILGNRGSAAVKKILRRGRQRLVKGGKLKG